MSSTLALQIRPTYLLTTSIFLYTLQYALFFLAFFLSRGAPFSLPTLYRSVPVSPVISYSAPEFRLSFNFIRESLTGVPNIYLIVSYSPLPIKHLIYNLMSTV